MANKTTIKYAGKDIELKVTNGGLLKLEESLDGVSLGESIKAKPFRTTLLMLKIFGGIDESIEDIADNAPPFKELSEKINGVLDSKN